MATYITINKDIVPWIKGLIDPSVPSCYIDTISDWEKGKKATLNQINEISKKTHIPFGYFFLNQPYRIEENSPAFRTFESKSIGRMSSELRDTINNMEEIQDWLKEYANDYDFNQSPIVNILKKIKDTATAAIKIREILGLEINWYKKTSNTYRYLRDLLNDKQVYVFENGVVGSNTHRPLDLNEFRAFALFDEKTPLVFINASDSQEGRIFSLLHEVIHIARGESDIIQESYKAEESFCNEVAAEIIVPKEQLLKMWKEDDIKTEIFRLAKYFHSSASVTAIQAYKVKLITRTECNDILHAVNMSVKRSSTGKGNFLATATSRLDHHFLAMLSESLSTGRTLYTDAYRMTGCKGKTFDKIMGKVVE